MQIKSVAIFFIVSNTSTVMDAFRFSPPDYKNSYLLNTVTIMQYVALFYWHILITKSAIYTFKM